MKLHQTHKLADGKRGNHGQSATLIEIESDADYDALLRNILETGYYDRDYFATHSNYAPGKLVTHFFFVAEMALQFGPRQALEIGCGRGDVLELLHRRGVRVQGIDFAAAARDQAWPAVAAEIELGDLTERCGVLAASGRRFDLVCGFDIWEHLHPGRLEETIRAVVATSTEDALFFFVIPAFGADATYGEPFPLEVEEARPEFEARVPFRHLLAERTDPPIPASGHLIWAHTEWWQRRFEAHGLRRCVELERRLHVFDPVLPYSNRSFYVFARDSAQAAQRERAVLSKALGPRVLGEVLLRFAQSAYVKRELKSGLVTELLRDRLPPGLRRRLADLRRSLRGH